MLQAAKRYSQPWYLGYAFQGAVVLGVAPILIPLIVGNSAGATAAGLVVAAFYTGQLAAPALGWFTDRHAQHKLVYLGGYALLALGLGVFALAGGTAAWAALALAAGAGSAATNTVAAMYIVEFQPKAEWDQRVGWLQTFYGTGQAVGLGLAALLQLSPLWGMAASAALMAPGAWLGLRGLPASEARNPPANVKLDHHQSRHPKLPYTQLHRKHGLRLAALADFADEWRGPFGLFIAAWLLLMFGTWLIYNLYPLLMRQSYAIGPGLSSVYYAVAATLGVFVYAPSGALGRKIGDAWVVMIGVIMTLVSTVAMTALALWPSPANAWAAPLAFILMPVAWSPLIVGGTALTAQIADMAEGNALGVFNSATAVGSVLAAVAAGGLADWLGYNAVLAAAAAVTVAGLALLALLMAKTGRS